MTHAVASWVRVASSSAACITRRCFSASSGLSIFTSRWIMRPISSRLRPVWQHLSASTVLPSSARMSAATSCTVGIALTMSSASHSLIVATHCSRSSSRDLYVARHFTACSAVVASSFISSITS